MMIVCRWDEQRRAWARRPRRVTNMIANRFMHGRFILVICAETTRARVMTGHIL